MLFAEALSYPSEARTRLLVPLIANWVDPASLAGRSARISRNQLRERIRPLEIVRTAREERDTTAAPGKPLSLPTLRLKKRGLS